MGLILMKWWLAVFGALASSVSVFSLVHKHWPFKLAELSQAVLVYYDQTFHYYAKMISDLLAQFAPIYVPPDAFVLWAISGLSLMRTGLLLRDMNTPLEGVHPIKIAAYCLFAWPAVLVQVGRIAIANSARLNWLAAAAFNLSSFAILLYAFQLVLAFLAFLAWFFFNAQATAP